MNDYQCVRPYGKCFVSTCKEGKKALQENNIKFFRFPKNKELWKKWRENLNLSDDVIISKTAIICSTHFEPHVLTLKHPVPGAVPTINLGHDRGPLHINQGTCAYRRCVIPTCGKEQKSTIFKFPKEKSKRLKWLKACNLPLNCSNKLFICARHFQAPHIGKRRLCKNALPTVHLSNSISPTQDSCDEDDSNWTLQSVEMEQVRGTEELETSSEIEENIDVEEYVLDDNIIKENQSSSDSPINDDAEHELSLEDVILLKQNRIEELEKQLQQLRNYCENAIIPSKDASKEAVIFAKMICGSKNEWYSDEEKHVAQNVMLLSTRTYCAMRTELGFRLPHKSLNYKELKK